MKEPAIGSLNKIIIEYGGISKINLLENLLDSGIKLNKFAQIIFSSKLFKTSNHSQEIEIIETSIKELGFPDGATISEINDRIKSLGLAECPLEAAPSIRLKLSDQQEMVDNLISKKNQNPPGSITIFSDPITADDDFPKGFYLRKIEGEFWLRGFICSMDYVWKASDRFIFKVE